MSEEATIKVPNIGGADQVDVIEVLIHPGDSITKEMPLITLESDKASMEIPSPSEGKVKEVRVKVGDKVSEGSVILTLESGGSTKESEESKETTAEAPSKSSEDKDASEKEAKENKHQVSASEKTEDIKSSQGSESFPEKASPDNAQQSFSSEVSSVSNSYDSQSESVYAGPAVRRMARELGVELSLVKGSGRKGRVSAEDIQKYVKTKLAEKSNQSLGLPKAPSIDFSQFGSIEVKPLNKIKKLTGANVHRAWLTIPHVTQFDEADITELEAFRKSEALSSELEGYRLTLLAFVTKIVSKALTQFPQFNASLDPTGEKLIFKQYYNIGIAVETPNGLVVPVLRDVDRLSVREIALQMGKISKKAREKGLMPNEMSGGCFTISSLGGIGGTAFTPIVNSPEVAILGLSRSAIKPVYKNGEFQPRLVLPLSLSYDHRVIDGAEAARFARFIAESLEDIRRILL